MELSEAAKRNWHHRDVERALIASGDHSPRTARELVDATCREAPAFGWNDVAAAHWVRLAPQTAEALGVTHEEQAILADLAEDTLTTILACGGTLPEPVVSELDATPCYLEGYHVLATRHRREDCPQEHANDLEAAEERRINRAAGGLGVL